MTVLAFVLFAVAIVVMVLVHRKLVSDAVARMEGEVQRRQLALDKQAKVFVRRLARTEAKAARSIDRAEDLNTQITRLMSDRRVQRLIEEREREVRRG